MSAVFASLTGVLASNLSSVGRGLLPFMSAAMANSIERIINSQYVANSSELLQNKNHYKNIAL